MIRSLILAAIFLGTTPSHAQTYLDQVKALFDSGSKPSLTPFMESQVWEGRCVNSSHPDQYFDEPSGTPYAHLIFYVQGDEVVGRSVRMMHAIDNQDHSLNPDAYIERFRSLILIHGSAIPRSYESVDFNGVVQWYNPQRDPRSGARNYSLLRTSVTAAGKDFFVEKNVCDDPQGCSLPHGDGSWETMARGQVWGYCYFTERLSPSSVEPSEPTPPLPPPTVIFHPSLARP